MGHFSMTCSISGLPITGGTPVRCLLLTASPYVDADPRKAWLPRTPPIRAVYDDYGSVRDVHPDDAPIVDLWLRGLREDVVELGLGDNSVHDVPVPRDMTLRELLAAVQGRLKVRQDPKNFWRRPDDGTSAQSSGLRHRVETLLGAAWPDRLSRTAEDNKFHVDEPVPHLVRVRWHETQGPKVRRPMLNAACALIQGNEVEPTGLVGAVVAGTGRYTDDADLLVFPAPAALSSTRDHHVVGPLWDMGSGQDSDENKTLPVRLAMIREDVWQALIAFPHYQHVTLPCENCGQFPFYHENDECPTSSGDMPHKAHSEGSTYTRGPVFPPEVPHFIKKHWAEYAWHELEAFKEATRSTWARVSIKLARRRDSLPEELDGNDDDELFGRITRALERLSAWGERLLAAMSPEDRAAEEVRQETFRAQMKADEVRRRESPFFGDYLIRDQVPTTDCQGPGASVFYDSTPGIIGITEHLSMLIADKAEAAPALLDAIAELSAVQAVIHGVGVVIRPTAHTGPQDPQWSESARFARVVLKIAEREAAAEQESTAEQEDETENAFATYAEAKAALCTTEEPISPTRTAIEQHRTAVTLDEEHVRAVVRMAVAKVAETRWWEEGGRPYAAPEVVEAIAEEVAAQLTAGPDPKSVLLKNVYDICARAFGTTRNEAKKKLLGTAYGWRAGDKKVERCDDVSSLPGSPGPVEPGPGTNYAHQQATGDGMTRGELAAARDAGHAVIGDMISFKIPPEQAAPTMALSDAYVARIVDTQRAQGLLGYSPDVRSAMAIEVQRLRAQERRLLEWADALEVDRDQPGAVGPFIAAALRNRMREPA